MMNRDTEHALFTAGDYLGAALCGGLTAAAVRVVITPHWDMVVAMLMGMAIGMLIHLGIGLALSPLLGMLHVMVPGSLIGMYGGMFFAMRDTMQMHSGSLASVIAVGIGFGLVVNGTVHLYGHIIRGPVSGNWVP